MSWKTASHLVTTLLSKKFVCDLKEVYSKYFTSVTMLENALQFAKNAHGETVALLAPRLN
ncbi:MAG: hypothetical protein AAF456_24505 [Planctomycetota bacterium]